MKISSETKNRIQELVDVKPIPNPCPEFEEIGYKYIYQKGMIDKTKFYTRVEEDSMLYVNPRRIIRFNLASRQIVIQETEDNANFYGGKPTLFIHPNLIHCINKVMEVLEWDK